MEFLGWGGGMHLCLCVWRQDYWRVGRVCEERRAIRFLSQNVNLWARPWGQAEDRLAPVAGLCKRAMEVVSNSKGCRLLSHWQWLLSAMPLMLLYSVFGWYDFVSLHGPRGPSCRPHQPKQAFELTFQWCSPIRILLIFTCRNESFPQPCHRSSGTWETLF